jgi:dimethylargininase
MNECQLTYMDRSSIDLDLLSRQHDDYERSLKRLGCEIVRAASTPHLPDSVFVEDTVVVLDDICVMTRPGAPSRQAEVATVAEVLSNYREVETIDSPATIDGGDVMVVGKTVFVGASTRTNQDGFAQLKTIGTRLGYTIELLNIDGCLHLKSAVSFVGEDTLLVNLDRCHIADYKYRLLSVAANEPDAANALYVNGSVVFPLSFPETSEMMLANGIKLEPVDVSEIQKAEGGVTCCSIVFES